MKAVNPWVRSAFGNVSSLSDNTADDDIGDGGDYWQDGGGPNGLKYLGPQKWFSPEVRKTKERGFFSKHPQ